ncbi:MAG TPA: GTPase-associated protein 1-related protein [Streptosporangiaceae bacterium]|nr:GTPase-associated protein 1-related protein [Streptosporangiaceae bacterium]
MPFQQLYYTSCEHGLGGYGGYQFNAATPGVPPAVLREVEERTVYEPPRWLTAADLDEPGAYPVAFSHGTSHAAGTTITARVVSAGTDYSGRPGNYFAHALVTSTPAQDFGPLLPAELWEAAVWQETPVTANELPELSGPLAPGVVDRPKVQAFLDARAAAGLLPGLLTAAGQAMAGERPVLLVTDDVSENAWWIAAISYLLGEYLARQMTFTTYSHRPGYSRYHVTGALPGTLPPEASASFQIFDFAAGRTAAGTVHPLAAILAGTGVMAAAGLWRQAEAFASGTEASLDDWLAPVAAAASLLGQALSPAQVDAVARWLPGAAGRMPSGLADAALGAALGQPTGTLADERLRGLLELARRLPAPPRAEHLERMLAERALTRIARGEPAAPVPAGPRAGPAGDMAIAALHQATPRQALAVLEWTAASGIALPEAELERFGRTRLGPEVPEQDLARLVRFHLAVRRGLLQRLASEPPEVTGTLLSGPVGTQLERADLDGHPALTELWLLESVARGRERPLRAFDEIADIRNATQRSPGIDATLLGQLWPRGCPPEDLTGLLGILADSSPPDVLGWFTAQLRTIPARAAGSDDWLGLARVLAGHQILDMLPEQEAGPVRDTLRVLPLLHQARREGPSGNAAVFAALSGEYTAAGEPPIRALLDRELPALLARARPLAGALCACPDDLAAAACRVLRRRLATEPADIALARRVFIASGRPEILAQQALAEGLSAALEQVGYWSRHDLDALAESMAGHAELAQSFRRWRKANRGGRTRWRPGRAGSAAPRT